MWFDKRDTESAKIHYVAYYKSIELKKCLKISPGHYYFRGYEITYIEDRPHNKKWGIAKVSNYRTDTILFRTKTECIKKINEILSEKEL